jgi:hypothetical protein
MIRFPQFPRGAWVPGILAVLVIGVACDDDEPVEPEPEVAVFRLIFPGAVPDTVFVDAETGAVTSGPITISVNSAFTAQFLKDDGTPETIVNDASFRLDVTPTNTAIVTFTRTSPFSGTLNKVTTGSTSISFALFHLEEMHNEFSWPVPITVN